VTSDLILQVATGYMAAKHLLVANELGIFQHLASGPQTLDQLAKSVGVARRTLRILADALVALGFIARQDGQYWNGPAAAHYLSGSGPADLRPFLRGANRVSYPAWNGLEEAVRADRAPTRWGRLSEEDQETFSAGIEVFTAAPAAALAKRYDFGNHQRLLDVGGGTGSFLVAILTRHPGLLGTLFELPTTAPVALRRLAGEDCAARVEVVAGNVFEDALPSGHDAVLLANVSHLFTPEHNLQLLSRIRQAVFLGARLLWVGPWTDTGHTQPALAALLAGEFLIMGGEGDVYSAEEGSAWLAETGWRRVRQEALVAPESVIIAEAV
jgi:hypothetical protein